MPSLVPITFTRSESQLSLRGVGEKSPYMMDGLAIKSVQKQTVNGLMSESCDFLSKSLARDNILPCGVGWRPRPLDVSVLADRKLFHNLSTGVDVEISVVPQRRQRLSVFASVSLVWLSTAHPLKQDVYVRMLRRLSVLNDGGDCWLLPLRSRLLQRRPGRNA